MIEPYVLGQCYCPHADLFESKCRLCGGFRPYTTNPELKEKKPKKVKEKKE